LDFRNKILFLLFSFHERSYFNQITILTLRTSAGWEGFDQKMDVFSQKTFISEGLQPAFQGPEQELPWTKNWAKPRPLKNSLELKKVRLF